MYKKITIITLLLITMVVSLANAQFEVINQKTISSGEPYLTTPKWSPDGQYIAAAGEQYGSIWLYFNKSKKWRKIVEENGAGWDFAWSPNSKNIAFRSNVIQNRRKTTTIKYINVLTDTITRLVDYDHDFSTPKWLNNEIVAFLHNNEYKTVYISRKSDQPTSSLPQKNICLFAAEGTYTKQADEQPKLLEQCVIITGSL